MTQHIFKCSPYESGILIEVCDCGAVKYGVAWYDDSRDGVILQEKVQKLNRLYGKEGNPLDHEDNNKTDQAIELPPVPPRPKGAGRGPNSRKINREVGRYYDDNRAQIEKEVKEYGETKTRLRWSIPSPTWTGLKHRWSGIPRVKKPKVEKPVVGKPVIVSKEVPILREIRAINDRLAAIENKLVAPEKGEALFNEKDQLFLLESVLKATNTKKAPERAVKILNVLKTIRAC